VIALVEVDHNTLALGNQICHPLQAFFYPRGVDNGEDPHVVFAELIALFIFCPTMPRRDEYMTTVWCCSKVSHGSVLYHLALARLDRSADDNATALRVLKQWENRCVYKVGKMGPVNFKIGYRPGFGHNRCHFDIMVRRY
jgi:hypothetical protein